VSELVEMSSMLAPANAPWESHVANARARIHPKSRRPASLDLRFMTLRSFPKLASLAGLDLRFMTLRSFPKLASLASLDLRFMTLGSFPKLASLAGLDLRFMTLRSLSDQCVGRSPWTANRRKESSKLLSTQKRDQFRIIYSRLLPYPTAEIPKQNTQAGDN